MTYRHYHFCAVKVKTYWKNNIYLSFFNFFTVLEYGFNSAVTALEYLFSLAVGFFKGN